MPTVSAWCIRAALLHLVSGAGLGAASMTWKAAGWPAFAATHLGVHQEQMLVGWVVQLVIGVAFWILPRPEGHDAARAARRMWVVFVLLNAGVLLAALGTSPVVSPLVLLAGRLAETAAVILFGAHAWSRQRTLREGARRILV